MRLSIRPARILRLAVGFLAFTVIALLADAGEEVLGPHAAAIIVLVRALVSAPSGSRVVFSRVSRTKI